MRLKKMLAKIKKRCFRIRFKATADYEKKARMLRKVCYHIGENTRICNDDFGGEPYMISIDDNTIVAGGVRFINHDASFYNARRYLDKEKDFKCWEKIGPIKIGKNCFIGANSLLLMGTDIGDNSIIAAGAVVNKKIPPNEVWGGVPAHFIMSVDNYAAKVNLRIENLPWILDGKKHSETELIKLRQEYFIENANELL